MDMNNDGVEDTRSNLKTSLHLTASEVQTVVNETNFTSAKAWVAGGIGVAVAFLGALTVALTDGAVTPIEWTVIGSTTLVAAGGLFGGVYATPNTIKR